MYQKQNESKYRNAEKEKNLGQIEEGQVFYGGRGGKPYFFKEKDKDKVCPKPDLLLEGKNNLYKQINNEVVLYFSLNKIRFHHLDGDLDKGFCIPSGHTLSSQIACLNHLFPLRYDKENVLAIAKVICPDFVDVLQIGTDEYFPAYIQFEAVSEIDHLNEVRPPEIKPHRGEFSTSIDALIYAVHKNHQKYLIPIEWKYTEDYDDNDYSIEDRKYPEFEKEGKGKERLKRYSELIDNSKQLKVFPLYKSSIYFFEPFYQLMRQTLWAEQMIKNKNHEKVKADDFIHVHVIPKENKDLLDKKYKVTGKNLEDSWTENLEDKERYKIITPMDLLKDIHEIRYFNLKKYLTKRYWGNM